MDLFDLGEGFSSLLEGVARIQCPTLVSTLYAHVFQHLNVRIIEPTALNRLFLTSFRAGGSNSQVTGRKS